MTDTMERIPARIDHAGLFTTFMREFWVTLPDGSRFDLTPAEAARVYHKILSSLNVAANCAVTAEAYQELSQGIAVLQDHRMGVSLAPELLAEAGRISTGEGNPEKLCLLLHGATLAAQSFAGYLEARQ